MTPAKILTTLLIVALIAVVCWLLVSIVPMPSPFGMVIVVLAIILTLIWLVREFGGGLG